MRTTPDVEAEGAVNRSPPAPPDENPWLEYERRKSLLREQNLTPEEYQRETQRILDELLL